MVKTPDLSDAVLPDGGIMRTDRAMWRNTRDRQRWRWSDGGVESRHARQRIDWESWEQSAPVVGGAS